MKQHNDGPGRTGNIVLLLLLSGTIALLISGVSAETSVGAGGDPVVTLAAYGSRSYYLGEMVQLTGQNTASDSTYLFITGPNIPDAGAKLTSPREAVVSGNPGTFTVVKTKPDKTWEYSFYTANLPYDAGSYTLYAAGSPVTAGQAGTSSSCSNISIILKKPFLAADISPANVVKGKGFSVTGYAEGNPPEVQVWIIGKNYVMTAKNPVNQNASFMYTGTEAMSGNLPAGQYWLFVQHPMQNNQFDIAVSGDYVSSQKLNNGTTLFKISGAGCLQGIDAAEALIASFAEPDMLNVDTYTVIPFQVTESGSTASPQAPAGTGITITADGTRSYYLGEKVVFRGQNADSDTTYIFLTGPNLADTGVNPTSPGKAAASGNADSFVTVKTKPDKTWEYTWYTANLPLFAGTYTMYAVSQPKALDLTGTTAASIGMIIKKPFISAQVSPAAVTRGQPFTVTGTAEGDPPSVQVWIFGKNYVFTTKPAVDVNASFAFNGDAAMSAQLPEGQNYLFVQHSMQNNQFDIDISGDFVRNQKLNNGTILFKITGAGSLQGIDAADALVAAFSDTKTSDDTYTVIPFQVSGTGSAASPAAASATAPVTPTAQPTPLQYAAPIGAGALLLAGIVLWKRQ